MTLGDKRIKPKLWVFGIAFVIFAFCMVILKGASIESVLIIIGGFLIIVVLPWALSGWRF
jgi:hypothetical protein